MATARKAALTAAYAKLQPWQKKTAQYYPTNMQYLDEVIANGAPQPLEISFTTRFNAFLPTGSPVSLSKFVCVCVCCCERVCVLLPSTLWLTFSSTPATRCFGFDGIAIRTTIAPRLLNSTIHANSRSLCGPSPVLFVGTTTRPRPPACVPTAFPSWCCSDGGRPTRVPLRCK